MNVVRSHSTPDCVIDCRPITGNATVLPGFASRLPTPTDSGDRWPTTAQHRPSNISSPWSHRLTAPELMSAHTNSMLKSP